MLTALNEKGDRVNVLHYNKTLLLALRRKARFHCPVCEQGVQLKIGEKKIPHFAHHHNNSCPLQLERESHYHLMGKEQLYWWLISQGMDVQLEPYLRSIRQRPDLLIHAGETKLALEYQCSTLSPDLFLKRTRSYWNEGFRVVWILGGNQFKRTGVNWLRTSTFHTLFTQYGCSSYLLYFCPHAKSFYRCSSLIPFSVSHSFSNIEYFPLHSTPFTSIITPSSLNLSKLSYEWNRKKRKWRENGLSSFYRTDFDFLSFLYGKGISPSLFPSEVAIPLPSLLSIHTPALLWQSYMLLDEINSIQVGECFSLRMIVSKLTAKRRWSSRLLPYFPQSFTKLALFEYAVFLQSIGLISQVDSHIFRKLANVYRLKDGVEALRRDEEIMKTALSLFTKQTVTLL